MTRKTETKSWWECPIDGFTYESPTEGTLSVSHHPGAKHEDAHALKRVKGTKYDDVSQAERKERHKDTVWYTSQR